QGQIVVSINNSYYYDYLNGFMITEQGTDYASPTAKNTIQSTERKVLSSENTNTSFNIFPDPIADRFTLHLSNNVKGTVTVQIADMNGIIKKQFHLVKDSEMGTQFYLNAGDLSKGTYIIRIQSGSW